MKYDRLVERFFIEKSPLLILFTIDLTPMKLVTKEDTNIVPM